MSLKTWYIGRTVKGWRDNAVSGKSGNAAKAVWAFLDGKKTFIWTGVMAAKLMFPHLAIWSMVDAAAKAIGWSDIAPVVDPNQLVTWIALGIALGHKLEKALKEPEWKVIGPAPEIKPIPKLEEDAPVVVPVKPAPEPGLIDFRSKAVVPVGTRVLLPQGEGVIMMTKETSPQGYTYAVRML